MLSFNMNNCERKGPQSKIQKIDWKLQVVRCVVNPYLSSLEVKGGGQENTVLAASFLEIERDTKGGEKGRSDSMLKALLVVPRSPQLKMVVSKRILEVTFWLYVLR